MANWRADGVGSRRQVALVGTLLVVAAGAVVAARTVDVGAVLATVRGADPVVLVVAVGVYAFSWPLRGHRYDEILGVMGHRCGVGFLTATVFLSQTANVVLPARAGDGARAYVVNTRRQVPYATGGASLALERLFDLVAIAVLGTAAVVALARAGGTGSLGGRVLLAAATVGVLSGLALVALVALARSGRALGPAVRTRLPGEGSPRVASFLDSAARFGSDLRTVAADSRALATVGATSLAVWALDVSTAVLVLVAVETTLSVPAVLAAGTLAVSVGNLAKVVPLSQGGVGLYEAGFTGVVVAVTPVGAALALAAALLDHALKNAVTLAGGGLAAVWLNVSPTAAEG